MNKPDTNPPVKKMNSRQLVALLGVIVLVLLYIITLFAAIFDSSEGAHLFAICLFCTVAIPILIWLYSWIWTKLTGKKTIASVPDVTPVSDVASVPETPSTHSNNSNSQEK